MRRVKCSLIVVAMMAVPAYASLYSSDFEGLTVGNDLRTEEGSYWNAGGAGVVAVDPLDAGNTVADMSGGSTTLWMDGYPAQITDPVVQIDFDVYISNTSVRALTFYETDYDTSDVIYTAWGGGGAGTINRSSLSPGGVTTGWVTHAAPTADNTWMHATYVLDQPGYNFSLTVDGTPVIVNEWLRRPSVSVNTATWDVGTGYTVLVDNIAVTIVPEPATLSLLGLGGLLLRRKRK